MSREIKFRIWDKTNKSFLCCPNSDDDLFINMHGDIYLAGETLRDAYDLDYWSSSFYEISQFTGLKDKKEKEIYEGDILKYGLCVEVVFYEPTMGRFMTELKKCNDESEIGEISSLSPYYTDNYEVIGNIYENPELLGGENE